MSVSSVGSSNPSSPHGGTPPSGTRGRSSDAPFSGFLTDAATRTEIRGTENLSGKILNHGIAGLVEKLDEERREKELRELALAALNLTEAELEEMEPEARAAAEKRIAEEIERIRIKMEKEEAEEEEKKAKARAVSALDPALVSKPSSTDP